MEENKTGSFIDSKEVLRRLGIKPATLYRWIQAGKYPPCTVEGRPNKWLEDVHLQWVEEQVGKSNDNLVV